MNAAEIWIESTDKVIYNNFKTQSTIYFHLSTDSGKTIIFFPWSEVWKKKKIFTCFQDTELVFFSHAAIEQGTQMLLQMQLGISSSARRLSEEEQQQQNIQQGWS